MQMNFADFLNEYGDVIKKKVVEKLDPIYKGNDNLPFDGLLRQPINAQKEAVEAIVKGFKSGKKALFAVGEMGVGKTFMALSAAYLSGAKRVIIMCPPHLVQKWMREAKETIPNVKVYNLNGKGLGILQNMKKNGWSKPETMEVFVVGREKAKLHYKAKSVVEFSAPDDYGEYHPICPSCKKDLTTAQDTNFVKGIKRAFKEDIENYISKKKPMCPFCGEPLWQADNKTRRYAKADFIKRYLKGAFDLFIVDEVHELKGGTTAQGNAFASIASASKKTLALTGTLMGGYATNLFFLLWRMFPRKMKEKGFKFHRPIDFAEEYGVIETSYMDDTYFSDGNHIESIGGVRGKIVNRKEKAGVSPLLLTDFLLDCSIFVRLSDIADNLVEYNEEVVTIPMVKEQSEQYSRLENNLRDYVARSLRAGNRSALGKLLQPLLGYPDNPREPENVYDGQGSLVASAKAVQSDMFPKEEKLLEIIKQENEQERKVLVYVEHTGTRDILPSLKSLLEDHGYSVASLYSATTTSEKRERWIKDKLADNDIDVLLVNPRLVQTGLDLIDFPTIIFYQTGYSVFTLRQASRRSWRIGQDKPVKVYYLAYEGTMQAQAIKLMAAKLETALAVEGDLSDKGLAALSEGEMSIVLELARKLVDNEKDNTEDIRIAWEKAKIAEIEADSYVGNTDPVTIKTTIEKGSKSVTFTTTRVARGSLKLYKDKTGKVFAVALVDNKYKLLFKNGKVFYGKKVVGKYNKEGKGQIKGKSIEIIREKERFALYEVKGSKVA